MFVRSYYLRVFFGAFVIVTFPYTIQYTLFTPPPPTPQQTKIDFNVSWVGVLPISSKELLSSKLGDSPYQTSLLRANHYIKSGHSCTIRKVAFVFFSMLKCVSKGGRALSLQLAFSRLLFPLSATRKTRPVH